MPWVRPRCCASPGKGGNDAVIGKLPGIHADLRGKTVRMSASANKVQVFHNGQSLHYR
jgi:alpha-glucoside transport system ATP-binding protein